MKQPDSASASVGMARIEIARILEDLRRRGVPITAYPGGGERLFVSRLLLVEPGEGYVLAEYSPLIPGNAALLELETVLFHASEAEGHIEFEARGVQETEHSGRGAIRFPLPVALARMQRREHPRFRLPEGLSLRCVADSDGVAPFEARVVDFSLGGMGTLVYDSRIRLEPGTHLPRSKIVFPDAGAVLVDLEVRYARPVVLEDGSPAARAGCRFVGSARDLERLAQAFVSVIGSADPARGGA